MLKVKKEYKGVLRESMRKLSNCAKCWDGMRRFVESLGSMKKCT